MDFFNQNNQGRYNMNWQNNQRPQINPQQFIQVVQTLDQNSLSRLVSMARSQGIPDSDIQAGLNFISSLH